MRDKKRTPKLFEAVTVLSKQSSLGNFERSLAHYKSVVFDNKIDDLHS